MLTVSKEVTPCTSPIRRPLSVFWSRVCQSAKGRRNCHSSLTASGFSLIIALVMMGFMLLLALSLSSLTQVSIASFNASANSKQAQQNALFGLQIAIGQLQKYAGPDRHTSARADITISAEEKIPHPYWTGVWGYSDDVFQLQTYLVSGNHNNAPLHLDASNAQISAADSIVLLGATDPDGEHGEVIAQRVTIEQGDITTGAYAYWISDEGVKAKVNLPPQAASVTDAPNSALLMPRQLGITRISNLGWMPQANGELLSTLIDTGTLSLLAAQISEDSPASVRKHFHDITLHSFGVLSNSKDGGLKRDLTVGLTEDATTPAQNEQLFGPIGDRPDYAGASLSALEDPGGPTWGQLRSWVNTPLDKGSLPVRPATDTQAGYSPVLVGFQLYYVPTYDPNKLTTFMQVVPAAVLWNPYDVPLETADYIIRLGRPGTSKDRLISLFSAQPDGSGQSIRVVLQTGVTAEGLPEFEEVDKYRHQITPRITNPSDLKPGETYDFFIPNVSLQPGSAIVYSPAANDNFYHAPTAPTTRNLSPGFRYLGYATPLRNGTKSNDTERLLSSGDHDNDPNTPDSPLTHYQFTEISLTRIGALQLLRSDTGGDPQVLADALHLNLTPTNTNTDPPPAQMEPNPAKGSTINLDVTKGIGWKIVRRFSSNDAGLFTDHRQPYSQLRWLIDLNPRASTSGPNQLNFTAARTFYDRSTTNNPSFISLFEVEPQSTSIPVASASSGAAYTGHSEAGNIANTILFEAPRGIESLSSVGQLTHAPLFYWDDSNSSEDPTSVARIRHRMASSRFDNLIPAFPIGNSKANPAIALNRYYTNFADHPNPSETSSEKEYMNFTGVLYDYSWLLNDALWDAYFFSTLIADDDADAPGHSLRNPRLIPLNGPTAPAPTWDGSATTLLVDGAFNINSTSVEAWKAVLASFYGKAVLRAGGQSTPHSEHSSFLRIAEPHGQALTASATPTSPEAYNGYRALDNNQIDALAQAIVTQVKLRGPFPTLSAFVNRSLSAPAAHQLQGALSAAIEEADINAPLKTSSYEAKTDSQVDDYIEAAGEGYTTEGLPGWLTPADLLSRLGSVLSARSDTFLIRSYGEYTNPRTQEAESKAWCEAIVQRLPQYIDSVDNAQTLPDDINATNAELGRRFVIVSFRWLNEDEL